MTTPTHQPTLSQPSRPSNAHSGTLKLQTCPLFTPATLKRQLAIDAAMRWAVIALVVVYLLFGPQIEAANSTWSTLAVFALIGIWIAMGVMNTRTVAKLPQITILLIQDPQAAESALAEAINKRPLSSSVRLLLYHRLAMLRMQQHRFAESAAICQAVLSQKVNLTEMPKLTRNQQPPTTSSSDEPTWLSAPTTNQQSRTHLLLMLVEARLQCRDIAGAYTGLYQLHQSPLGLIDRLQLMTLQTRYELAAGYHAAALQFAHQKIQLSELLPAPQCGMMHAMLATAATKTRQSALGDWLNKRAQLLCTPEQLQTMRLTPIGSINTSA